MYLLKASSTRRIRAVGAHGLLTGALAVAGTMMFDTVISKNFQHSKRCFAHSMSGCVCAGIRVLRLAGNAAVEGNNFAASLPGLDIDTLPALPQLGRLSLFEVSVCSAPCQSVSELCRSVARRGVESGINRYNTSAASHIKD